MKTIWERVKEKHGAAISALLSRSAKNERIPIDSTHRVVKTTVLHSNTTILNMFRLLHFPSIRSVFTTLQINAQKYCTKEIKMTIAMGKEVFNGKVSPDKLAKQCTNDFLLKFRSRKTPNGAISVLSTYHILIGWSLSEERRTQYHQLVIRTLISMCN